MPALARISPVGDSSAQYDVMFNPASLKVSLSNRLQDEDATGGSGQSRQNTRVTTFKLETELLYDTTDTGHDVRDKTRVLKGLATATRDNLAAPKAVEFRWGRFSFVGVIESLNETLDFWAAEGIPLRATIQLVIQNVNAAPDTVTKGTENVVAAVAADGKGTTGAASQAGDPRAGRAVAAANGIENMRMAGGGAVAVAAGVQLKAAAGFSVSVGASAGASAGAGFGIGATAGAGASASFGASASAGFGASASAGFGASASAGLSASASAGAGFGAGASAGAAAGIGAGFGVSGMASATASARFGATASAGVSASAGAFAGLGTSRTTGAAFRLDPARLLPPQPVAISSGTQFDVTGRVVSVGASGLMASVVGTSTSRSS